MSLISTGRDLVDESPIEPVNIRSGDEKVGGEGKEELMENP